MNDTTSRRDFLSASATASLAAATYARAAGSNERLSVGIVGPGGRGRSVMKTFISQGKTRKAELTACVRHLERQPRPRRRAGGEGGGRRPAHVLAPRRPARRQGHRRRARHDARPPARAPARRLPLGQKARLPREAVRQPPRRRHRRHRRRPRQRPRRDDRHPAPQRPALRRRRRTDGQEADRPDRRRPRRAERPLAVPLAQRRRGQGDKGEGHRLEGVARRPARPPRSTRTATPSSGCTATTRPASSTSG